MVEGDDAERGVVRRGIGREIVRELEWEVDGL